MKRECVQAVATALGRELNQVEVRDIEQRLTKAARALATADPAAWTAKPKNVRLEEAAQRAAQELVGEAQLKAHREALQIAAGARLEAYKGQAAAAGLDSLEAHDRKVAFHPDGKADTLSIETQAKAIRNDLLRRILPVLEAGNPRWFGLFESREGVDAITKELHGEKTGDADAAAGAKAWKEATGSGRERFNAAGGDIGQLEDWGMPHHHSQVRVARAGRDAWLATLPKKERYLAKLRDTPPPRDFARDTWVAEVLPKLNRSRYVNEDGSPMTTAQLTEFLNESWVTIATGGANKVTPGQFKGGAARANRGNATRQIHFKDAQAYLDYQTSFGDKSLFEVLVGHIEGISKDIALVEEFGPNPDHAARMFREQAVQELALADPARLGEAKKRAIKSENLYNFVAGRTLPVASERLARNFDTLRNWITASRLDSAVISSLTDDATLHLTARLNDLPAMQVLRNELAALNPANKMEERMAMRAGLALNTFISSLNRFGQDGLGASFSSKLANGVIRAQGLSAITEARRRAFGVTAMGGIGAITKDHASLKDVALDDHRILKSKGVTEEDFGVWKAAEQEDWGSGNTTMLTPESIYRIPDEKIDKAIGPRIQKIKDQAKAVVDELNDRNAQDQTWADERTTKLRDWVKDQQTKLAAQAAKADDKTKARLQGIARRMGALYDQIDTAGSYFKSTKTNQVSLDALRRAGVSEGQNEAATTRVAQSLRAAMSRTAEFKQDLDTGFRERFVAKEQEINDLDASGADESRIAFALGKFDELFDSANARLTERLDNADEALAKKIKASVERVKSIRAEIASADKVWQQANAARPNFSQLRSQGVREGRAREASSSLKQQVHDLTREIEAAKKEKALDFAERWAARKFELDEFVSRGEKRIERRQQVADRINRELDPAIERARVDAREKAVTRLLGIVLEETDMAVIEPGAKERAMMGHGIQRGTWKGELARSFFLFKSFPLAMLTKHWMRGMSQPNRGGRFGYIATLMAATTLLGAAAMQVKEVIAGRDPRNLNIFKEHGVRNWMKAFLQGGSLGIYGDFLFSESTQHGQSPVASFLGPVIGLGEDAFKLTQGNVIQAMTGKDTDAGAEAIKFLRNNLPIDVWYTKAAMDHMIWNQLAEYFTPGYLGKVRRRAQREFGQEYYWDPADPLPSRGPDITAVAGQ